MHLDTTLRPGLEVQNSITVLGSCNPIAFSLIRSIVFSFNLNVDNGFYPAFEHSALQEHTPATSLTFDPNISTQSNHLPIVAAAGVLFSQAYSVSNL